MQGSAVKKDADAAFSRPGVVVDLHARTGAIGPGPKQKALLNGRT